MVRAEQRLWRTGDGRLVADGDPAGAVLAYTPGDDIAPRDESLVPDASEPEPERDEGADSKAAEPPANKARRAGNK